MLTFSQFKAIVYACCQQHTATAVDWFAPDVTPNFYAVRIHQHHTTFYVLCNHDQQWAYSQTFEPHSCQLNFVEQPAFSQILSELFDIRPLTVAELRADFQPNSNFSAADIRYWKPQCMGNACFNWWD